MSRIFNIDPDEFQLRKKARIEEMRKPHGMSRSLLLLLYITCTDLPTGQPAPLVSAPTNHEVTGFMPGRLEFEHEVYENEAEQMVKDFEFGLVWKYGGDEQPQAAITKPPEEEEDDAEVAAVEVKKENTTEDVVIKQEPMDLSIQPEASGSKSGGSSSPEKPSGDKKGKESDIPVELEEDEGELEVKLALLEIYFSKLDKREEAKDLIFDRGLTEMKKVS
jgi:transcriptional adapter 2-alpha